jgi:hypothetical protein
MEVVLVVEQLSASDDSQMQVCFGFQNANLQKVFDMVPDYV